MHIPGIPRLLVVLLGLWLCTSSARADIIIGTSPGELTRAHGGLACPQCHRTKQSVPAELCLSCHQPIAQRIQQGRGVHGTPPARGRDCRLCHGEHRGAEADLLGWAAIGGRQHFDHGVTGYALAGRHGAIACDRCHRQQNSVGDTTYLALPSPAACEDCHAPRSPHGPVSAALRRCDRCHGPASWRPRPDLRFDHQHDTRFPLSGAHLQVDCASCHRAGRFKLAVGPVDCVSCHANAHGGALFGRKHCSLCHDAGRPWPTIAFDHDRTRFPLRGPHQQPCGRCHPPAARAAPQTPCASVLCHKDPHQGRFRGFPECTTCHAGQPLPAWGPVRFAHDRLTRFALDNRHAQARCRDCHRGAGPVEFERLADVIAVSGTRCQGCHRHRDAHRGDPRATQPCLACHRPGRLPEVPFALVLRGHGPPSPFPLTGGHDVKDCGQCHRGGTFSKLPLDCGTCHKDPHQGSLGATCLRCHEGSAWPPSRFDHRRTAYPLSGRHRDVRCDACHPAGEGAGRFKPRPRACGEAGCHREGDPHRQGLGPRCVSCHRESGWKDVAGLFRHERFFPLRGRHAAVPCARCHPQAPSYRPPTPTECQSCHARSDVHRGDLGPRCARCHEASAWKAFRTGHDVPPEPFGGAHDRVPCTECHGGGRVLRGMAQMCISCHQRDDIHHNSLGPRCADCHTQHSFAGARFQHDTVGCTLRGLHRVLPCVDCHKGGNYAGLSPACVACHRDDAIRAVRIAAGNAAYLAHMSFTSCTDCHNTSSFRPVTGYGQTPPDSVCQ